ncbi:hypothetical protein NGM10_04705 [Halorussus salilacus]|uniref:hypothetical protein n=1 Tax=Halorussus salilacus TaxID=2953750 RepID=UPI00209EDF5B|nr:hypothetical protein [Halorussus salilacus]USZ69039.1 hypothetical protein NGM10_04705 [Halorussus salilacus]
MKSKLGAVLLVVAGLAIFAVAAQQTFTTYLVSAVGVLALAAGALLLGTAGEEGRPV